MELASILETHWPGFARAHRHLLTAAHDRAAAAVLACRTAALGAQVYRCGDCDKTHIAFHSCNHRACPKCGGQQQQEWAQAQEAKLLPVPYFMITFTLPEQLRGFARKHQRWFYDVMFDAVAGTLKDFAKDARHLGGMAGFTAVLHTWTRQMQYHPHLHVIMPGVALRKDGLRIFRAKGAKFLFPVKALGAAFRNRLRKAIERHDSEAGTTHHTQIDPHLWKVAWVVDSRGVGNGQSAVRYLARYVSKTALSQQRLLGYDPQGNVRLNCQNSGSGQWQAITLTPHEFLRRWSQHVLPKGLMRLRHYGFLSAAAKHKLERLREILGAATPAPTSAEPTTPVRPNCPCCGKAMHLRGRVEALPLWRDQLQARLTARGPPQNQAA